VNTVEGPPDSSADELNCDELFTVDSAQPSSELNYSSGINSGLKVQLQIEKCDVQFQVDTGCGMSIVPKEFYNKHLKHLPLKPTSVVLEMYTKEVLKPLGEVTVNVV